MKPDWDELSKDFGGVYDVDCTAGGKELCEEVGVSGYPTIKYGDAADRKALKTYEGGRDLPTLKKFAEENLGPICGPGALEACTEDEKVLLQGFMKRTSDDLLAESKKLTKEFGGKQKKLDKKVSKLKDKTNELKDDRAEADSAKVKKGKEAAHKAKIDKLEAREEKLNGEIEGVEAEQAAIKEEMTKSGVKLMDKAAQAMKGKTDL